MKEELLARLQSVGQEHLLAFWEELDSVGRERLAEEIRAVDFDLVDKLFSSTEAEVDWTHLAEQVVPPPAIRLNGDFSCEQVKQTRRRGEEALAAGKLGLILVAGGQGTRLGFEHPKGMFPLGPISNRPLFQILIEQLLAVDRRYCCAIPLYLMTSPATHGETVRFLAENDRFGLPEKDLHIFCQGTMPAVDARTGKLLLAEPGRLALSPDGHGGALAALQNSGCLDNAKGRGVEQLFYGQVDNPLTPICDPFLIGCHLEAESEMTTLAVKKIDPMERVGNVAMLDNKVCVIEYSDLPEAAARRKNENGSLKLWAGNTAIHIFAVGFLDRVKRQAEALPFHRALKKTPYLDSSGKKVDPPQPNAVKFERFIFDLAPAAKNAIVVEGDKSDCFAPVKNADGEKADTPQTAKAMMVDLHSRWLQGAGVEIDEGVNVEISPLWALDQEEAAERVEPDLHLTEARYFC